MLLPTRLSKAVRADADLGMPVLEFCVRCASKSEQCVVVSLDMRILELGLLQKPETEWRDAHLAMPKCNQRTRDAAE